MGRLLNIFYYVNCSQGLNYMCVCDMRVPLQPRTHTYISDYIKKKKMTIILCKFN